MKPLVGGLMAAIALAVAGPASAATPGITIDGIPSPENVNAAADDGAKIVHFFLDWDAAEPSSKGQREPGYVAAVNGALDAAVTRGVKVVFSLIGTPAWARSGGDRFTPPDNPADYGDVAAWLASRNAGRGVISAIAIWNEQDEDLFWHGKTTVKDGGDTAIRARAAEYAPLLNDAHDKIKATDASIAVLVGGLTGGNTVFVDALYSNGSRGKFDGVGVDTAYACLTDPPDYYYRASEGGPVARITFLAFREVRETLLANGDAKPVWLLVTGWSTTQTTCERGTWAGQKPAGVSEAAQAANIAKSFSCLARDEYGYVPALLIWSQRDKAVPHPGPGQDENERYGLRREDGSAKPALAEFQRASRGEIGPSECGDFTPPSLTVLSPKPGQQFVDRLDIQARANDAGGSGFARMTFQHGATTIRNFTGADAKPDTVLELKPWYGSRELSLGAHTIVVKAVDQTQNVTRVEIPVTKVKTLAATLLPRASFAKRPVRCKGRRCTFSGRLNRGVAGSPSIGGKVSVEWQWRNKKGKYRKLVGGQKPASKPFKFSARLKRSGRWRVRMVYKGLAPWKPVKSKFFAFRVR